MEELVKAVKAGNLAKVKDFVRKGLSLEERDRDGWMVLHHVAKSGNVKVAEYVVGQGVDVNCKTTGKEGFQATPLLISCQEGNMDMVKYLLGHGADIKAKDRRGRNVLHFACESNNLKLVEYFIGQKFDVNCKDTNSSTPLLIACSKGQIKIAKYLLGHGADMNVKDRWVGNVLHHACEANSLALVVYLVGEGADVNCKGAYDVTPLLISCEKGNIDIVKCLLGNGADIKSRDKRGRNVLSYGRQSNNRGLEEYLKSQGAVYNIDTMTQEPKKSAAPPNLSSDVAVASITTTTATAIFEAPSVGTYDCFKISIDPWTNGETLTSLVNTSGTTYHALFSNLVPGTDYKVAVGTVVAGVAGTQRTKKFKTCEPRVQEDKPAAKEKPEVDKEAPERGPAADGAEVAQPPGPVIIQQIAHVSGTGNIGNIHNEGTFIVNVTNTRSAGKKKKKKKQKKGRGIFALKRVPKNGNASTDEHLAGSSSSSGDEVNGEAPEGGKSAETQRAGTPDESTTLLQVQQHDFNEEESKVEAKSSWCCW